MRLRYGMNPHQTHANAEPVRPGEWPIRVLRGEPSYVNLLDALNGWRLVAAADRALGRPAAASFKHVSPAGAALAGGIDGVVADLYGVDAATVGPLTSAYLRARDADPRSSYGDLVAVSRPVDAELADVLRRVVSDGVIAPGYEPGTVETLGRKKNSRFLVLAADPAYRPPDTEVREIGGLRLTQECDAGELAADLLDDVVCGALSPAARDDLLFGLLVLRSTQSNSVCYLRDGMTLGIGAGQQSRVDCTRLAGAKAQTWWLRRHPAVRALAFRPEITRQDRINWQIRVVEGDLTPDEDRRLAAALRAPAPAFSGGQRAEWLAGLRDVAFASDGALPFRDNVDHAHRYGVGAIAEPGGSVRSAEVEAACREHGIALARTGLRLFHH